MCILGSKSGIQSKIETFYVHHFNVETVIHASDCFLLPFGLLAIKLCLHPQLCVCCMYMSLQVSTPVYIHAEARAEHQVSFSFTVPLTALRQGQGLSLNWKPAVFC